MNNILRSSVLATSLAFIIALGAFAATNRVKIGEEPILTCSADPLEADTETFIQFSSDFEAVDEDIDTIFYWEFGDGSTSDEAEPMHSFGEAGTYEASLTVQHGGVIEGCSISIIVTESVLLPCDIPAVLYPIYFEWNSSEITDDAEENLEDNLNSLLECPDVQIMIEGFAALDETPASLLSQERADAVSAFYVDGGLEIARILDAAGKGIFEVDEENTERAQKVETFVWSDYTNQ